MYLKMIAFLCLVSGFSAEMAYDRNGYLKNVPAIEDHAPAPTRKILEISALENSIKALAAKKEGSFIVQPELDTSFKIMKEVCESTKKLDDRMNQSNDYPFFGIYELIRDLEIAQKDLQENTSKIDPVDNDNPGKKLMDQYAALSKELLEDAEKTQKRVEDNSNKLQDAIKALLANPIENDPTKKLTPIKDILNQLTELWGNLSAKDLTNVAKVNPELTGAKPGTEIADADLARAIDLCTTYESALKKMRELCTDPKNLHGLYDVRMGPERTTEQFVFFVQNPFLPAKLQEDTADLCKDLTIKAIESGKVPCRPTLFMFSAGMISLFRRFGFQVFNGLSFQQPDGKPTKKLAVKELDGSTKKYESSEKAGDVLKSLRSALRGEAHMRDYPLQFSTPFHRFTYWMYLNFYSLPRETTKLFVDGETFRVLGWRLLILHFLFLFL